MWPRLYDEDVDEILSVMKVDTTTYMQRIKEKSNLMQKKPHEEEIMVTWVSKTSRNIRGTFS